MLCLGILTMTNFNVNINVYPVEALLINMPKKMNPKLWNNHFHLKFFTAKQIRIKMIILFFSIFSTVREYFRHPVSTVVGLNFNPPLRFPGVTFCNMNRMRKSKMSNITYDIIEQVSSVLCCHVVF